jgi:DNA helicase-2/ATP-dependent DNA helicase PcrA
MIVRHGMEPSSICAVTFTNKAANEMRARLIKLVGKEKVDKVKMGTFHSICALFLRKYGRVVDLDGNFTICDSDERYVVEASTTVLCQSLLQQANCVEIVEELY